MREAAARRAATSDSALRCAGGEYRIYDQIGVGGMASVHLARFFGAGGFARTVAVKRPLPALQASSEFRRLGLREALLAARVQHPHVVATLDVVDAEGELLIVMEYVAGEPLSVLMERVRRLERRVPLPVVAALIGGALRGLAAVHGARDERGEPLGLIHRDVSPQNILVGVDGLARLADFGLARATGTAALSNPAEFKGKLTYASPEQVELRELTPATDLYPVGVILWELFTGRRLYRELTTPELVSRLLAGNFPRPSQVAPDLPEALDALVLRALARDPAARHDSALGMAVELDGLVRAASLEAVTRWLRELTSESLDRRMRLVIAAESDTTPSQRSAELAVSSERPGRSGPVRAGARDGRSRVPSIFRAAPWRVMALSVGVGAVLGAGEWLWPRADAPSAGASAAEVVASRAVTSRAVTSEAIASEAIASEGVTSTVVSHRAVPSEPPAPGPRSSRRVASEPPARALPHEPPVPGGSNGRERPAADGESSHGLSASASTPARANRVARAAIAQFAVERLPGPLHSRAQRRPAAAGGADCSPPFSLDAQGIRHMKPGCQ